VQKGIRGIGNSLKFKIRNFSYAGNMIMNASSQRY
jgi:hypothetical protein